MRHERLGASANLLQPARVSNFIQCQDLYLWDDSSEKSSLNVTTIGAENTWFTVGPTGSFGGSPGATDHIWTGLDGLPHDAKAIGLSATGSIAPTTSVTNQSYHVRARLNGTSIIGVGQQINNHSFPNIGANEIAFDLGQLHFVPLDHENKFQLSYNDSSDGVSILMYLHLFFR